MYLLPTFDRRDADHPVQSCRYVGATWVVWYSVFCVWIFRTLACVLLEVHITSCQVLSCPAIQWYVMVSCHVSSCHSTSCRVLSCYVM